MPKMTKTTTVDPVERDFMAALERLQSGQPLHRDLARKAKLGTLQINISTVALEAGRSRTLIGMDGCAYPRARAAILALKEQVTEPRTAEDVIRRLREEKAELKVALRAADSENAALVLRLRDVERTAKREIASAERRARRPARDPHAVAGRSFEHASSEVVPFPAPL